MTRDLNGRPVRTGRWAAVRRRIASRAESTGDLDPHGDGLVVVAESFDHAAASSTVLADSAWRQDDQAVVRHLLSVSPASRLAAVATAALDGYQEVGLPAGARVTTDSGARDRGLQTIALARPQLVDALHISQERSRMAGLAARHGGAVLGWQILQAGPA